MQSHHLVKRSRRRCDLAWNLLRLCDRCHRLAELENVRVNGALLPKLSFGHCLWLKRESDRDKWQPELLALLYGRPLPELEQLPALYIVERGRWSHGGMN